MTPEQWRQVRVLFDVAGQLPPRQRSAFLRNACAEEPALRQEVESLLRSAAEAGDFLEGGALHDVTWLQQPPAEELAEDLGRRLAGSPDSAPGGSSAQRVGRLLRRHTWAAVVALLALLAIALAFAVQTGMLAR